MSTPPDAPRHTTDTSDRNQTTTAGETTDAETEITDNGEEKVNYVGKTGVKVDIVTNYIRLD